MIRMKKDQRPGESPAFDLFLLSFIQDRDGLAG